MLQGRLALANENTEREEQCDALLLLFLKEMLLDSDEVTFILPCEVIGLLMGRTGRQKEHLAGDRPSLEPFRDKVWHLDDLLTSLVPRVEPFGV